MNWVRVLGRVHGTVITTINGLNRLFFFDKSTVYVHSIYQFFGERDIPKFYSTVILSVLQSFNLIFLIDAYRILYLKESFGEWNISIWFVGIPILAINFFTYSFKNKRSSLLERKTEIPRGTMFKFLIGFYIVLTVSLIAIVAVLKREIITGP